MLGEAVSVFLDTSMTRSRPRDLGLACGNVEAELRWAPQEVIELHVPGEGPVAIEFDTARDGTPFEFNTVVQVRRECERVPTGIFPPSCFDDISDTPGAEEYRSAGEIAAMGGDVLYFYVTG